MSELADEGPSLRDHIESSYAASTGSPDVASIVNGAVEERDRGNRERARTEDAHQAEARSSDQLRGSIRKALGEAKEKAAAPSVPAVSANVAPGAPKSWDKIAQAQWDQVPQETRLAIQREQADRQTAIEPRLKAHEEIRQAFEPVREVLREAGIQDEVQGVKKLLEWESALRNPTTRMQAFHALARQYQVDIGSIGQSSPVTSESRMLDQFAASTPDFGNHAVTMGLLLNRSDGHKYIGRDGKPDFASLYRDAKQFAGDSPPSPSRPLAPPRTAPLRTGNGASVRDSILASVQQVRRTG